MNSYELSRQWFDFAFSNPEKISPNHAALYFFCIEHCNRLGWKEKFGLPSTMAKEAIGIKSYNTYINTLTDLIDWDFIIMIEKSRNQFSANIIALSNFNKARDKANNDGLSKNDKALDKAMIKHVTKHMGERHQSTSESISSIDKQRTRNKEQLTINENHQWGNELFEIENTEMLNKIAYSRSPKQPVTKDEVESFNGHLIIENKQHESFTDYCKHLRNWLNTKPKEKNVPPKKESEIPIVQWEAEWNSRRYPSRILGKFIDWDGCDYAYMNSLDTQQEKDEYYRSIKDHMDKIAAARAIKAGSASRATMRKYGVIE